MSLISEIYSWIITLPPLLYVVVGLMAVWYLKVRERLPDNIPPFAVRPYPILGHMPMLRSASTLDIFKEWRKVTGDIFSFKIGPRLIVVFNSCESIKEAFVRKGDFFSDRPTSGVLSQREIKNGGLKGIIGNNGANWKEQRNVSMQILRDFGMGKNVLAEKITEEIEVYLDTLSNFKGEPKDVRLLTNAAVANVIVSILVGTRFELDDPYFVELLKLLGEQIAFVGSTSLATTFPMLRHLPGDFFKVKRLLSNQLYIRNTFCVKFIEKAKENNTVNNFIRSYFDESNKKRELGEQTSLDEKNLIRVMSNLFIAGSETTSTTIQWALMFAIHHPKAQEKVYQEIVEFVGTERLPSMSDKSKLRYSSAFIMEVQRRGSIGPLGLTHTCSKNTEVGGYTIPAGASILANLDAVLKDEQTWGDPLVFRPERFLDKDDNVIVPNQFIPFSIGRRYCMGEALAKMELFLFITCIIQRFHILPEDPDNLPPLEPLFGVTCVPQPFRVRLVDREKERTS